MTWRAYLNDSEQAIWSGFSYMNAQMILCSLHNFPGPTEHARSSAAELEVIFANLFSVEHGVESCNLENLHFRALQNAGDLSHRTQS